MKPDRDRFKDLDDSALLDAMVRAYTDAGGIPPEPAATEYGERSALMMRAYALHRGHIAPESDADRAALRLLQPPADHTDDADPVTEADREAMEACTTCGGEKIVPVVEGESFETCGDCGGTGKAGTMNNGEKCGCGANVVPGTAWCFTCNPRYPVATPMKRLTRAEVEQREARIRVDVSLPTTAPVSDPIGACTVCGYPGPVGTKCRNPNGCKRVAADPLTATERAFIERFRNTYDPDQLNGAHIGVLLAVIDRLAPKP